MTTQIDQNEISIQISSISSPPPPPPLSQPKGPKPPQPAQLPCSDGPKPPQPPQPAQLPCSDLVKGSRGFYDVCVPLHEALRKGDWIAARAIIDPQPELVRFAITKNLDTPLHVAASISERTDSMEFVKYLVNLMKANDLLLINKNFNTAFGLAVVAGNVQTTKIILEKNETVLETRVRHNKLPLYVAALYGRVEMVSYLYHNSNKMSSAKWIDETRGDVLLKCVEAHSFDVAVEIANDHPKLITNKNLLKDVLVVLAKKTDAFIEKKPRTLLSTVIKSIFAVCNIGQAETKSNPQRLLEMILESIVKMSRKDIDDIMQGPPLCDRDQKPVYPSRILFVAAKSGNIGFIVQLFRADPGLADQIDDDGISIFHIAIKNRDVEIYNLLYEIGAVKDNITPIVDNKGNNMLHLVAERPTSKRFQNMSGVALQMQHELLWFREVEKMIPLGYGQNKNDAEKTPDELFTETHIELVKEAARWMKDTSPQCMVVATLIATIAFSAAFTLPGGYEETGFPILRQNPALMVFVISNAISLMFSTATVLTFLSMFTSRYTEIDFVESLPKTLMLGLATLFISILTLMIAFSASLFLLYTKHMIWLPIMVTIFAALPLGLFVSLQFRFIGDVFYATFRSNYLFKPKKSML